MRAIIVLLAAGLWCGVVHAQVPRAVNYQGYLTDAGGAPINTTVPMVFKLYTVASGGAPLYTEAQTVPVNNGLFDVVLGSVAPLNLAFDVPYYLGVAVSGDPEMTPRQLVTASPYALRSANADALAPAATVAGSQIANNTVTQAKLSPVAGAAAGKVLGTDGTNLVWQSTGGGGTVTSVATGTGLSGGPITSTGTILADTNYLQRRVSGSCVAGNSIRAIAADGTVTCQGFNAGPANAFLQNGNAFGGQAIIGTTDNFALDIQVNNARAVRYEPNAISPNVVAGSPVNNVAAGVIGATIAGGGRAGDTSNNSDPNLVTGTFGTVGGGVGNGAGGRAGGRADGLGQGQIAATVGGGFFNAASADVSTVGGGDGNAASGVWSTVGGGSVNAASGEGSTVGGGVSNAASGEGSTVGGGLLNTAGGRYSWAGGRGAKTEAGDFKHDGAFVWADSNVGDFHSSAANEFAVRATGGVRVVTAVDGAFNPTRTFSIASNGMVTIPIETSNPNLTLYQDVAADFARLRFSRRADGGNFWDIAAGSTANVLNFYRQGFGNAMSLTPGAADLLVMSNGAHLTAGGAWTNASDRNGKENFTAVDAQEVLAQVVSLPVTAWNYRSEPGVKRIGPMAQDFHAAFGVGADDRSIATVDADGVALAAIQGLNAKLDERAAALQRQIDEKDAKIEAQARLLQLQAARVDSLERQTAEIALLKQQVTQMAQLQQQAVVLAGGVGRLASK